MKDVREDGEAVSHVGTRGRDGGDIRPHCVRVSGWPSFGEHELRNEEASCHWDRGCRRIGVKAQHMAV